MNNYNFVFYRAIAGDEQVEMMDVTNEEAVELDESLRYAILRDISSTLFMLNL